MPLRGFHPALFFAFLFLLTGCATMGPPGGADAEAVRQKQTTIVLMRLAADVEGQKVDAVKSIVQEIAAVGAGEPLKVVFLPSSPSSPLRGQGWVYLLLNRDETYYLSLRFGLSPDGVTQRPLSPKLWFHVPADAPILYVGSLSVSCKGKTDFFGITYTSDCSAVAVTDESDAAVMIAAESFAEYGQVQTMLARPPEIVPPGSGRVLLKSISPMAIAVGTSADVVLPEWQRRALSRTTGIGGWLNSDAARSVASLGSGGYPGGAAGAGLIMGYLLYLPIGTALGVIGGAHSSGKWGPCMEGLASELRGIDPKTALSRAVASMLRLHGGEQPIEIFRDENLISRAREQGIKSILLADVQRVGIRECLNTWTFSLEVAVRARLLETTGGTMLFDKVFVNSFTDMNRVPYQFCTSVGVCRPIEDWCGDSGKGYLKEDALRAIDASVRDIMEDLGFRSD